MNQEERKVNKLLVKVKYKAYELKDGGQLPSFLFKKIALLGVDTPLELVKEYITLTDKYLRVKGFYKRFPEYESIYEEEVNKYLKERGLR